MRKLLTLLAFIILNLNLLAFSPADSLRSVLENASTDTARLNVMDDLVKVHLWTNPDTALLYAEAYDSIAQLTRLPKFMGKGKNFIGMCHHVVGDVEQSMDYYLEAIRFFEEAKDTLFVGILYNNIGACYLYRKKMEETIVYYNKALEYFKLVDNKEWISKVYVNLAVQYNELKQVEKSIAYNEMALRYYQEKEDPYHQSLILSNLAAGYFILKQYDKSLEYSLKALQLLPPDTDYSLEGITNINIGKAYLELDQPQKARPYLERSHELSKQLKSLDREVHSTEALVNYYVAVEDYKKAVKFYQRLFILQDSFFNESKDKALVEATTRFETEKKQQEIDLLSAKTQVQEIKIKQSRRRLVFYTIGILGLALLALLLLYAFQTKKKALAEKELLLKEIHHRVKNNLQVVTSLLNIQQRRIKDPQAVEAIQESKNRVESMALIHKSLYQNNDLSNINTKDYLEQLVRYIFNTYPTNHKINYQIDVQPIKMNMDTLIPLGLIVNELINNAIKYAFKETGEGTVFVEMKKRDQRIALSIGDNGAGLPDLETLEKSNSFGFKMVQAFARKLNASMNILRKNGSFLEISFDQ